MCQFTLISLKISSSISSCDSTWIMASHLYTLWDCMLPVPWDPLNPVSLCWCHIFLAMYGLFQLDDIILIAWGNVDPIRIMISNIYTCYEIMCWHPIITSMCDFSSISLMPFELFDTITIMNSLILFEL